MIEYSQVPQNSTPKKWRSTCWVPKNDKWLRAYSRAHGVPKLEIRSTSRVSRTRTKTVEETEHEFFFRILLFHLQPKQPKDVFQFAQFFRRAGSGSGRRPRCEMSAACCVRFCLVSVLHHTLASFSRLILAAQSYLLVVHMCTYFVYDPRGTILIFPVTDCLL